MKKVLFIVLFLITPFVYSESYIEVGIIPEASEWDNAGMYINTENIFYVDFYNDFEVNKMFHVGGDITIYMLKCLQNSSFSPIYTDYTFFTYLLWNNTEIGYRHSCFHPQNTREGISTASPMLTHQKAFDQFYIRLKIGRGNGN